jgi:transcription termination factor NusB
MIKVLGEIYYLDFDELDKQIEIIDTIKKEDEESTHNVNLVKFELFKIMIEVLLTEKEDYDENLGSYGAKDLSIPFRLAFNTLLKHKILKSL